jgi:hypothetical protein
MLVDDNWERIAIRLQNALGGGDQVRRKQRAKTSRG